VYFNAAPRLDDDLEFHSGGQTLSARGVRVPAGSSRTIEVDLFSEGDTGGAWEVSVKDLGSVGGGKPNVVYALDRGYGANGDKLNLTISVGSKKAGQSSAFLLISRLGQRQHMWMGLVGT